MITWRDITWPYTVTWASWSHDQHDHMTIMITNTVTITTISHVHYVICSLMCYVFPYVLYVPLCSLIFPCVPICSLPLFPSYSLPFSYLIISYLFFFVPSRHHTQSNLILATSTLASLPPLCDLNSYLTAGVVVEADVTADAPDVTLTADVTLAADETPLTARVLSGRASERERSRSMRRRLASVRSSESSRGGEWVRVESESGEWGVEREEKMKRGLR